MRLRILQGCHYQKGHLLKRGDEFECPGGAKAMASNPGRFEMVEDDVLETPAVVPISGALKAVDAIAIIQQATDLEAIGAFIAGEERSSVISAAVNRRTELEEELTKPEASEKGE